MADNLVLNAGSGGATLATDDVAGIHYQRVKLVNGTLDATDAIPGDAANGLDVDVTRLPALPAGTNNIGDVDVVSLPAGSLAAVTAKTGDYDTGAGTDTVPMMGIALPASGGAVPGGTSTNPVRIDPTGTTAQPVTDNGGSLTVDGSVDTELPAAAALADGAANPTAPAVGAAGLMFNGTTWDRMRGDTANGLDVDVTRLPSLPAGSSKIGSVDLDSDASPGAAVPATAQYIAGTDGTNARGIKTDAAGELQVDVLTLPSLPAGANNIGDVDIASALPAGANKIGSVNTELDPASSGIVLTVKFASVDTATSGDNTIVAAVVNKKLRVLSYVLVAGGTVNVRWKSGAATNRSGAMPLVANSGVSANAPGGLLETAAGDALVLNLSAAIQVSGHVSYVEV